MIHYWYSLSAAAIITLISLAAAPLLLLKAKTLHNLSIFLVSLAASALLGTAFLHILPEVMEEEIEKGAFVLMLAGFVAFYIGEKILHLHHAPQSKAVSENQTAQEEEKHAPKELGILGLAGDFTHNFIDGIILVTAFLTSPALGLITAAAIALHEIAQEIAIFGVLIHAGFSKLRAFILNFLAQTSVIIGVLVGLLGQNIIEPRIPYILLFAAGSFIYLGASDFVPEFKKERNPKKSLALFAVFLAGLAFMWLLAILE